MFCPGWFESIKMNNKSRMCQGKSNSKPHALSATFLWLHPIPKASLISQCPQIPRAEQGPNPFFALAISPLFWPSTPSSLQGLFFAGFDFFVYFFINSVWGLSSGCQEQELGGNAPKQRYPRWHSLSDHNNLKQIKFGAWRLTATL